MNIIPAFTVNQPMERKPIAEQPVQPVDQRIDAKPADAPRHDQVQAKSENSEQKDFATMVKDQSQKSHNDSSQEANPTKNAQKDETDLAKVAVLNKKKNSANLSANDKVMNLAQSANKQEKSVMDASRALIGKDLNAQAKDQLKKLVSEEEATEDADDAELGLLLIGEESDKADQSTLVSFVKTAEVTEPKKQAPTKNADKDQASVIKEVALKSVDSDETKVVPEAAMQELRTESGDGVLDVSQDKKFSIEKLDIRDVKGSQQNSAQNEPILIVADKRVGDASAQKALEPTVLIREALQETGNTQIVQRAQFILREEGAGEIRMTLKPEHLGTVKINLSLEDNRVLGRIVVESAEVKAAFDENMADLRERMRNSGLNMGELEVSIDQRHKQGQNFYEDDQKEGPFYSDRYREGNRAFDQVQAAPRAETYRSTLVDMKA